MVVAASRIIPVSSLPEIIEIEVEIEVEICLEAVTGDLSSAIIVEQRVMCPLIAPTKVASIRPRR